jgi:hypothetical protein
VRAAWLLLREGTPASALDRFLGAPKRFAASKGKSGLYHETITWAYLLLINERSVLDDYYSPERLGSDLARRRWGQACILVTSTENTNLHA